MNHFKWTNLPGFFQKRSLWKETQIERINRYDENLEEHFSDATAAPSDDFR